MHIVINRVNFYSYSNDILGIVKFSNEPFSYWPILYNEHPTNTAKFFCSGSQQYFIAIGCQIYNSRFRFLRNNIDYSAICLARWRNSFGSINIHECINSMENNRVVFILHKCFLDVRINVTVHFSFIVGYDKLVLLASNHCL